MSTNIVYNGVTYTIPATDDVAWGDAVSSFLIAIPSGMLTKVGGSWALTGSDLDLGAAFGISSIYLKTKTATPALAGVVRLAFADAIAWRASANNKDLVLKPNASNFLTWDNIALVDISTAQTITNKTINAPDNAITNIKNVNIAADASIDLSKINFSSQGITWESIYTIDKIMDVDVNSAAAISGSKINPDFGTQAVKLGGTYKVSLTADPTANYGIEFPKADGIAGQALVKSVSGELEFVNVPGLALNQYHILVGDSTDNPTNVDTNTNGDIKVDETTGATIKALVITNAMISNSAAIAFSKLEALPLPLSGGTLTGLLTLDNLGVVLDVAGTTPAVPVTGQMYWDKVNQTAALKLANTDVTLQIGQEMHIYCKNNTIASIPNGSIVYVSGATTGLPDISLAMADLTATSDGVIGITTESIGVGAFGYVTTAGKINDVKTDVDCDGAALTIGDVLYLSPTVAGGYTKTVSLTPAHQVKIGSVLKVGASDGIILCRIEIGQHMAELHDVLLANLANRDILEYDSAAAVWKNYVNPSIVTKEPTGFSSFSNMVLTWNEGAARNLTITNPLGTYTYLIAGVTYVIAQNSTKTKQITDTEGAWFFYFDSNKDLQAVQGFSPSLLNSYALCFGGYWDSTNKTWIMRGEERHGITMDWATHSYLHRSRGAVYYSGGALTTSANVAATVLATTPTAASNDLVDTQMGFDTLTMFDEDLELVLAPLTRITNPIRKLYRLGANGDWRVHAPGGLTIEPTIAAFGNADTGATGLCYINTNPGAGWQLTAVSNNDFFNTYVFCTNDLTAENQYVLIPGQAVSSTLAGAQALSVSNLALGSLPSPEMIAVYKFTWQYKDASRGSGPADNPVGVILQRVEDLRLAKVTGSSTTAAGVHNSLSGRSTATAHPASAITNTPSGNLTSTDQQAVNNELQSDIDTRATVTGIETLTNKTLQEAIVDNFAAFNHESAPAAAAAGTLRVFAKSDNSLYTMDPNGVESQVGSGSGAGEKNYITNGSAKSAITGWTTSDAAKLTVTRTTTASELPRKYTTASGIKILSVASADSTDAYISYPFNLDDVDLNKKLKVTWSQKMVGAYISGNLDVYIAAAASPQTVLHACLTTDIPAVDGVFTTSFDSASTAALAIVFKSTGVNMADNVGLVISDVVAGPGSVVTGAVVGEWTSFTPVFSTGAPGTNTASKFQYRRVGSNMEIDFNLLQIAVGTDGSGAYYINIPDSKTYNSTVIPQYAVVGNASIYDGITFQGAVKVEVVSSTQLRIVKGDGNTWGSAQNGFNDTAQLDVKFQASIPIAEWAGSGTCNVAGNDVEYASNSSTSVSGTDTTSFYYGPAGCALPASTASGVFYKDVKFQQPIQQGDSFAIEINFGDNRWFELSGMEVQSGITEFQYQNTTTYGVGYIRTFVDSYTIRVAFGQYFALAGATYGAAGINWSATSGAWYWRVRKVSASSVAGFEMASATSAGLMSTQAQTFTGVKTFTDGIILDDAAGQTALTYYKTLDHVTTFTANGTSPTTTGNLTVKLTRVGRTVIMDVPEVNVPNAGSGSPNTVYASIVIPDTGFRPTAVKSGFVIIRNSGLYVTSQFGYYEIRTNGDIFIYRDIASTPYTASAGAGCYYFQASWQV